MGIHHKRIRSISGIFLAYTVISVILSCSRESRATSNEAENILTPCTGLTLVQPYSLPGGAVAFPFAEGKYVEVPLNTIKTLSDDGQKIKVTLTNNADFVFNKEITYGTPPDGPLAAFRFTLKDNPYALKGDLTARIEGNHVTVPLPYLTETRMLVPEITLRPGYSATLRGNPGKDIASITDFSNTVVYDISGGGQKDSITVTLTGNTRLPVMSIVTEDHREILSKEVYLGATTSVTDNSLSEGHGAWGLEPTSVKVRGRGNSTWMEAKKPYKLKFDKKVSLMGEAEGKQWVLLANAYDASFLHNDAAFAMSEYMGFDWTPCSHFVELYVNHTYRGTYQLTEQIKSGKKRVNVTDDGFIVEIDQHFKIDDDDVTFRTPRIRNLTIKEPDVETGSQAYNDIVKTVRDFEETLYGEDWLDPDKGWQTLGDIESFAKWYVIHEISNHADHAFGSSCYFHKAPKGKITMGPVWDFDKSFGTLLDETATKPSMLRNAPWYNRLFEDPEFRKEVRKQLDLFKECLPAVLEWIDASYNYLQGAYIEDNYRWERLSLKPEESDGVWNKAKAERDRTKKYISDRTAWLEANLTE